MIVYADLNCPYCYALNEHLVQLGKADAVDWRPIEHAPDLQAASFADSDKQELLHEVTDAQSRASNITLKLPTIRPNSRTASALLAKIKLDHPEKEAEFRTAVYRALWHNDEDFSTPKVLNALLISVGLPNVLADDDAKSNLLKWHREWELGDFARNIPSLESSQGFKMLGFPPLKQLKTFLKRGQADVTNFKDASCIAAKRYSIAIITDNTKDTPNPRLLEAIANYHSYTSAEALINEIQNPKTLDLILLNNPSQDPVSITRLLKHSAETQSTPVVLISNVNSDSFHIEAYRAGVCDIFNTNINDEILGHRLSRMLRSKRNADKLYEEARIDALTELYNRREFDETLTKEWKRGLREKNTLSLLMIDLDEFKLYNDTYGHTMGDEALRRFANVLKSCVSRPTDLPVRYGGEEFAIILPNTELAGAKKIAELIKSQMAIQDIKHEEASARPYLTASIGIAEANPTTGVSIEEFIGTADKALYKAKESGRNCIHP